MRTIPDDCDAFNVHIVFRIRPTKNGDAEENGRRASLALTARRKLGRGVVWYPPDEPFPPGYKPDECR